MHNGSEESGANLLALKSRTASFKISEAISGPRAAPQARIQIGSKVLLHEIQKHFYLGGQTRAV